MYDCKLCDERVTVAKMSQPNKEICLDLHICVACFLKVNSSYQNCHKRVMNNFTTCVFCYAQVRTYGNIPICHSSHCRAKWYRFTSDRTIIKESIINGEVALSKFRVGYIKQLGFKVKIEAKDEEQTFLNGVKIVPKNI